MKHDVGDGLLLYELDLAFQRGQRRLAGLRKGHISYRGDTASQSRFRTTGQIIHPTIGGRYGFRQGQMHMRVNAPRQDQQPVGLELTLVAFAPGEVVTDFYNLLTTNPNVSDKLSLSGHYQAIADNEVLQRFHPPFVRNVFIVAIQNGQKQQKPTLSWSAEKAGSQCLILSPPTLATRYNGAPMVKCVGQCLQ